MPASYRRLFARPGATAFTLAGLLGRLSMSMTGVSLVVLLAERRGSYALAGTVAAAGLAAGAVGMPLIGRLVDRYGQARVSVPATLYNALPFTGLLLCVRSGAPDWTLYACWAACAATPNLGGMARARWAHLHRDDPAARHLANSFEQSLDELCFMAGPVLGMVLCTTVAPEAGMLVAGVLGSCGALLFAAQRRTEPPLAERSAGERYGSPLRVPGLRVLVLTFLATGVIFGSLELTTVAYADALGLRPAAGGCWPWWRAAPARPAWCSACSGRAARRASASCGVSRRWPGCCSCRWPPDSAGPGSRCWERRCSSPGRGPRRPWSPV